jgi:FlaA1/EpsC-like NDP-sugar epimerase
MIRLSGLVEGQDIKIEYSGLRPGEKLYEELLTDKEDLLPSHNPLIFKAKKEAVPESLSEQVFYWSIGHSVVGRLKTW